MSNLYLSYSVASSSSLSGLNQLINMLNPIFIFLQEVTLTSEQLVAQVGNSFSAMRNIDPAEPNKPGTAFLWRHSIEDLVVTNITVLRMQLIQSKLYGDFVNIYAPTGSQGTRLRRILFQEDLLPLIQSHICKGRGKG